MNLAEFVEETLTEILKGIRAAQQTEGGSAIGAQLNGAIKSTLLVEGPASSMFTIVEFDVSVIAETVAAGKAGLRVWSAGIEGEGRKSDHQTSRVRFAVQVKIPEGEKARRLAAFEQGGPIGRRGG